MQSCRILTAAPTVMAEMIYSEKVNADSVISRFNNAKVNSKSQSSLRGKSILISQNRLTDACFTYTFIMAHLTIDLQPQHHNQLRKLKNLSKTKAKKT